MTEWESIFKIMQLPIQVAVVALFYWLFQKSQASLTETWRSYLSDWRTVNREMVDTQVKTANVISEVTSTLSTLRTDMVRHADKSELVNIALTDLQKDTIRVVTEVTATLSAMRAEIARYADKSDMKMDLISSRLNERMNPMTAYEPHRSANKEGK